MADFVNAARTIEIEPGQARLLLTDAGGYRLQP